MIRQEFSNDALRDIAWEEDNPIPMLAIEFAVYGTLDTVLRATSLMVT